MSGHNTPQAWTTIKGIDAFDLVTSGSRGWAKYYSESGSLFIRIGNLNHDSISLDLSKKQFVTIPDSSEGKRTLLQENDILISITAELGMVAIVPEGIEESYVNQHVALARPNKENEPRYLAWFIASEHDGKRQLLEAKRGATKAGLGLPDIRNLEIPLPPLNEQRRIADKLDTTLAAIEACKQKLNKAAETIQRFRRSILAAAVSGELTREWREERGIEGEYKPTTLEKASVKEKTITYGVIKLGPEVADGVPCLRTSNVRWLHIETDEVKKIKKSISDDYERTILEGREVLINVRGTLGGISTTSPQMKGWNVSREIAVFSPNTTILIPEYAALYIGSKKGQRWLKRVEKGVAYTGINLEDLRTLPIYLPQIEEQQEIANRAKDYFEECDLILQKIQAANITANKLVLSILQKAFRGELVPQDPNDEPASVLLERIKTQREAEAAAQKPAKRGRKKKADGAQLVIPEGIADNHLAKVLEECGALSERALLAASELEPGLFQLQLSKELGAGELKQVDVDGVAAYAGAVWEEEG